MKNRESKLLEFLDKKLTNEELYYEIMNTIERSENIELNKNSLTGKSKDSNDYFNLTVDKKNNEIVFKKSLYDELDIKTTYIKFEGNKIIVKKDLLGKSVCSDGHTMDDIEKKSNIKIYIDNNLRYEKTIETVLSIFRQDSGSLYREIIIDENKYAIKKEITCGEEDYFDGTEARYLHTSNYEEANFDTRINSPRRVYMTGMNNITKEEYDLQKSKMTDYKKLILK